MNEFVKLSPNTTEVWKNRREQSVLVHVCGGREGGRDRDRERHAETSIDRGRHREKQKQQERQRLVHAGEENM